MTRYFSHCFVLTSNSRYLSIETVLEHWPFRTGRNAEAWFTCSTLRNPVSPRVNRLPYSRHISHFQRVPLRDNSCEFRGQAASSNGLGRAIQTWPSFSSSFFFFFFKLGVRAKRWKTMRCNYDWRRFPDNRPAIPFPGLKSFRRVEPRREG